MIRKYGIKFLFAVAVISYGVYLGAGYLRARALLPTAERFVQYFYLSYNSGDYNSMYKSTALEGCKCSIDLTRFSGLMRVEMDKLGPVRSWRRTGFSAVSRRGQTRIEVRFRVVHERGEAFEKVTIAKRGDEWLLTDYNVYSEALKK